jgi:hypothetical protein
MANSAVRYPSVIVRRALQGVMGFSIFTLASCASHGNAPGSDAAGAGGASGVLPQGTQQYTFAMDHFEVAPGAEFYKCQDVPNPFNADIAIVKTQSTVSRGVHHMYAFQIPTAQAAFNPTPAGFPAPTPPFTPDGKKTPVFDCPGGGFEFHPYFHLTQRADDTLTYPEKTGRSLKAAEAIRYNVHILNTGTAPITIAADVVVNYVKPTDVQQLAAGIFVFAATLQVPTGISTKTFSYGVTQNINFLQMTGHMHRRGTHYEAKVKGADGTVRPLYTNDSWDEPPTLNFAPPLSLVPGDVIEYSCTYNNETAGTLTYGESAANNEMCNLFGVFFPAADGNILLGPV